MDDQNITVGTPTALASNTFVNPGYTFAGWNTKADGTGTDYANGANYTMTAAANINLYAKWTLNSYVVTATAGANGSVTPATQTINQGATTTVTVTPAAGY